MRIAHVVPQKHGILKIISDDGRIGLFDVTPYLEFEAFKPLKNYNEFKCVRNAGYFIEWKCGADLSSDTIEARWLLKNQLESPKEASADGVPPPAEP
jgi:hypothetical protein